MLGGMSAIGKVQIEEGEGGGEWQCKGADSPLKLREICSRESELLVGGQMHETEIMGNDKVNNFYKYI